MDESGIVLFSALIGALIGAGATGVISYLLAQNQKKTERKNIAKALLNEITYSEIGIINFNKINSEQDCLKTPYLLVPQKFQYSTDMYFDYEKDIAAFNPDLSMELYKYHRYLHGAESSRINANMHFEKWKNLQNQPVTPSHQEMMHFYEEGLKGNSASMIFCMKQAEQLLPSIKKELNTEIED